jgi:broad specificity phosphatase PhoE
MPTIVLIRHGETEWSRMHRHTGRTDLPLTTYGEAQARQLRRRLASLGIRFSQVWSSPLRRASDTCALAGFVDVCRVEPDLREWDCGEYEGLTLEDIRAKRPHWNLYRDGCPGGESPDQIRERADAVISELRRVDGPVAVFSHMHLLCALTARWIGLDVTDGARFRLDEVAIGILGVEHNALDEPSIAAWNVGEQFSGTPQVQVATARRRSDRLRLAS